MNVFGVYSQVTYIPDAMMTYAAFYVHNFETHVSISEMAGGGYTFLFLRPKGHHGAKAITRQMEARYWAIYEGEYSA